MRKQQKEQIRECIQVLREAHGEISKYVKMHKPEISMDLLGQCQENAIKLGTLIEKEEGEGFVTIGLLEDYCESLYHVYEKISLEQVEHTNKLHKLLNKSLIQIENSVRDDIPVQLEVVFLSYKASMWDSLESIWRAADEDTACNAYVIPIPYYDRDADGNLDKIHYEGNDYPDDVPIVHYDSYSLEQNRPDMIFIHNPYDEYNRVTSVDPFFYSSNLKKFTEQLIYVPYFILEEVDPENEAMVEGIKHFCTVPGVINADKVIVQSEAMRKVYVDVMTEVSGKETKSYWENKILGLGSPKVDKAISMRKEDVTVPESWKNHMVSPDGHQKKVIFYNTSLNGILYHRDRMIEKMRYVFDIFKECRDEVALLWRPHPLMKATIDSMCPELSEAYETLVRRYCEEDIGIYDDSADMNRALAISDAYYGDHSSLVQLCKEAGIPVMIQNVEIRGVE